MPRTVQEELSTSKTRNEAISLDYNGVEQAPVTRHDKKVLSKYIVVMEESTTETQNEGSSIQSTDDVLLTKIVDEEEMLPRTVELDVIEKEEELSTTKVDEENSSRKLAKAITSQINLPHGAKLNFNPFVFTIFIFIVIRLISNNMNINYFMIKSLRDFCLWGMPIYWVAEKEEIRIFVKRRIYQAKSRWGYY